MSITGYMSRLPPPPEPAQLAAVVKALKGSKKPVIYLGGGTLDASPEVREFVSRTGIPVVSTLMGLGSFPSTDPLALQMLGMHGTVYANYSVDQADLLIALGVRFDDRVTGKLEVRGQQGQLLGAAAYGSSLGRRLHRVGGGALLVEARRAGPSFATRSRIIHIDIDPAEIHKNKTAHIPICSDVKPALRLLNRLLEADPVDKEQYAPWVQLRARLSTRGRHSRP
ncbi:acetolactate synthase I/II/III largesubunit [Monoraphidium neglectum]|uniref:Acetolactate synthase I/II/III largesubunit n=1 Tax=Monoraphidium neglectum TaxID=145388 RepID=A0A0D2IV65_9CHLO|nr:acetolactate synthase I/II/III largesubunit [Monoraphidium neglectum]KIY91857.1 acetolactate synthase I/II/III largesubunit [Monoraphidium neglectum]|eukprot:XP_013890877.1 acetolactate synthase I/II/III largesubunit [Monoraphidium neglectum]